MNLEKIGFYTLSDARVANVAKCGISSSLSRCELILLNSCNFKCPYCRGLAKNISKTMSFEKAKFIVDMWASHNLKNIRFSGGEPTIWPNLVDLVAYTKSKGVERIAISSNGSASTELYDKLIEAGVNDFSISLDACCASFGDKMAGGIPGAWIKVANNIKHISSKTYVTVGIVVTEETLPTLPDIVRFADDLGVADIRIISAAQFNRVLENAPLIPKDICEKHPILKYRIDNIISSRNVRGISETDSNICGLALDDMAIAGEFHFPCIIYMREGGSPIGKIDFSLSPLEAMNKTRKERSTWVKYHNSFAHPICSKNCLDVCVDYNNKYAKEKIKTLSVPDVNPHTMDASTWRNGSIQEFGIACREASIIGNKRTIREKIIGKCDGEQTFRSKKNTTGTLCFWDGKSFWFHLRNHEFVRVFED